MSLSIALLFVLLLKHFICDFPLQAFPWMYKNKGRYFHPGGLLHSFIHAAGTGMSCVVVLIWYGVDEVMAQYIAHSMALVDYVAHYHIDWAKVNINKRMGWTPVNSEMFWVLVGFDQLLHQLTYFGLVWGAMKAV